MTTRLICAAVVGFGFASLYPLHAQGDQLKKLYRLEAVQLSVSASKFCQVTQGFQASDVADSCCLLWNSCGGGFVDPKQCEIQIEQCNAAHENAAIASQAADTLSRRAKISAKQFAHKVSAASRYAPHAAAAKIKGKLKAFKQRAAKLLANAQRLSLDGLRQETFICEKAQDCRPAIENPPIVDPQPVDDTCILNPAACDHPPVPPSPVRPTPVYEGPPTPFGEDPRITPSPGGLPLEIDPTPLVEEPIDPCVADPASCDYLPGPVDIGCRDALGHKIACPSIGPVKEIDLCALYPKTCRAPLPVPAQYICTNEAGEEIPCP
ncbi:MAG: hypothetical protein K1X83_10210 [Oligoflexia bacterium]|nr:hypothetical protein [Oligoflexia bacterium]